MSADLIMPEAVELTIKRNKRRRQSLGFKHSDVNGLSKKPKTRNSLLTQQQILKTNTRKLSPLEKLRKKNLEENDRFLSELFNCKMRGIDETDNLKSSDCKGHETEYEEDETKRGSNDVTGGCSDVTGGCSDVTGSCSDVMGGCSDVTGGCSDVTRGYYNIVGDSKDLAEGFRDMMGDFKDVGGGCTAVSRGCSKVLIGGSERKQTLNLDDSLLCGVAIPADKSCQDIGRLVWGKLGRNRWWPAIVVAGALAGLEDPPCGSTWVFWLGDHKLSKLPLGKIKAFVMFYSNFRGNNMGKHLSIAVNEALKLCEHHSGVNIEKDLGLTLEDWATQGFHSGLAEELDMPDKDYPLPQFVMQRLLYLAKINLNRSVEEFDEDPDDNGEVKDSAINLVQEGQRDISEICLSCDSAEEWAVCEHPLFEGGLCASCKDSFMQSLHVRGEDRSYIYCAICGNGGTLLICDSVDCCRSFCIDCIAMYLGGKFVKEIEEAEPWYCFLCRPYCEETHGPLIPRRKMLQYSSCSRNTEVPDLDYMSKSSKEKIRVLSLFDGIGTGKVVLDKLHLDIEAYYTCEIDGDALMVTSCHHGDSLIQLGDVLDLTHTALLEKVGHIDLLIGGSPCNDFSIANPKRKGFSKGGSGNLFFEFYRIMKLLTANAEVNNKHLFWMFENVASMTENVRCTISRFLEAEPALWDSMFFSAQKRARYFWGNIPGIYRTPYFTGRIQTVSLGSMLTPHCNRVAKFDILKCVTSGRNSMKMGKNDDIFPVLMHGKDDDVWITELERIFGFPTHYTDVGNLSLSRRQSLIGKAWDVAVVTNILLPITQYFKT